MLTTVIGIFLSAIASGIFAVWGSCLMGHDLNAGYPFPDTKAIVLFLIGFSFVPLVVAFYTTVLRRAFPTEPDSRRSFVPISILLLISLGGLLIGVSAQSRNNHERDKKADFYSRQKTE